jgi:hypothetical protein
MLRESRWLIATVVALAVLTASAGAVHAQTVVYYQPAPVVPAPVVTSYYAAPVVTSYYAAPAPVVTSYYAAPAPVVTSYYSAPVVTSYYAAAPLTTYRYGPFGRLRSVSSYYGSPVYYSPAPTVVRYRGWAVYP